MSDEQAQTLSSHLLELRNRLLRMLVVSLLIFAALFPFADIIYIFVSEPLRLLLPENTQMIATDITSTFFTPFKLTFVLSVFIAMPFILHQCWSFIAPGMYTHEKKLAIPILISSIILFYLGIAFAYYIVFPLIFGFFTSIAPSEISVMPDIHTYLNLVLKLFFAFGVAFEIPIATFILIWTGFTTPESLAEKRPYVIVGCFIFGMLLTPPDMISQTLLAIPMWFLFEVGILFGRMINKDDENEEENESKEIVEK